jgi:type II secretory pathway pseudopilin PulG
MNIDQRQTLPHRHLTVRRAFTLLELVAILIVVSLLMATFVPYALSLREDNRRILCADQLNQIGQAMSAYAALNDYFFPRVRFDPNLGNSWTAFTGHTDPNPFADNSAVKPNDVTASLYLLVRGKLIEPSRFVCPSSKGRPDPAEGASARSNFSSTNALTYGYASPFSSIPEYRLNDTLPSRFALMSDRAPDPRTTTLTPHTDSTALRHINSPNHRGRGQNILFADLSVHWMTTPYVGLSDSPEKPGDNIYSALAAEPLVDQVDHTAPGVFGPGIGPSYRYDSVLVPAAGYTP